MPPDDSRQGVLYALGAYLVWGLFPLYFAALSPAGPWEILAHRILGSLLVCMAILAVRHNLGWIATLRHDRRLLARVTAAAVLIAVNWMTYVYAVMTGRATDASLGYFLNPIATVALGVIVLGERLRVLQWIAVGIGAAAGIYLTVSVGQLPWISLTLALTFAAYTLVKKRIGSSLGALPSLAAETGVLTPAAVVVIVVAAITGTQTFVGYGTTHALLLMAAGPLTALPLVLFAAAAKRVRLVTIGMIQFLTPGMQLVVATQLLGETVSLQRWIGFGIVWIALVILVADMLIQTTHAARRRQPRPTP